MENLERIHGSQMNGQFSEENRQYPLQQSYAAMLGTKKQLYISITRNWRLENSGQPDGGKQTNKKNWTKWNKMKSSEI